MPLLVCSVFCSWPGRLSWPVLLPCWPGGLFCCRVGRVACSAIFVLAGWPVLLSCWPGGLLPSRLCVVCRVACSTAVVVLAGWPVSLSLVCRWPVGLFRCLLCVIGRVAFSASVLLAGWPISKSKFHQYSLPHAAHRTPFVTLYHVPRQSNSRVVHA